MSNLCVTENPIHERESARVGFLYYLITGLLVFIAAVYGDTLNRDFSTYEAYFNSAVIDSVEPTFYLLVSLAKHLNLDAQFVLALYSSLAVVIICGTIPKYSPFPLLSVLMYSSFFYFSYTLLAVRAGLALSIALYSLSLIIEKKYVHSFIGLVCAVLIHKSLFIYALVLPLYKIMVSRNYVIYLSLLSVVVFVLLEVYGPILLNIISTIDVFAKVDVYLSLLESHGMFSGINLSRILPYMAFSLLGLYVISRADKTTGLNYFNVSRGFLRGNPRYQYLVFFNNLVLTGVFVFFVFYRYPVFAYRLSDLFLIGSVISLPIMISYIKQKNIAYIVVLAYSIAIMIFSAYRLNIMLQ